MADQPLLTRHSSPAVHITSTPTSKKVQRTTMSPRTREAKASLNTTSASFTPLLTPSRGVNVVLLSPSRTITETLNELATSTAKELEKVWDEIGLSPEDRASQLSDLLVKFRDLCEETVLDEKRVAETFRQTIRENKQEIEKLAAALKEEYDTSILDEQPEEPLFNRLEGSNALLNELSAKAQSARDELKECQDFLIDACDAMGFDLEPIWRDIESDLTTARRQEFHEKRIEMREALTKRTNEVIQVVQECQRLLRDLHFDTEDGIELDRQIAGSLVRSKDDSFIMASRHRSETCVGISTSALNDMKQRLSELISEKRRRQIRLQELGAEISTLWEKLDISHGEQQAFASNVKGLSLDTLKKGEDELKRLNEIKAQMLGKLVSDVRTEIQDLWEQTNLDPSYRDSFEPMKVQDEALFDDDLLEKHEIYKHVLEQRLEEMKPILRLIERREAIIIERMEYELLQKDPQRLKQRGAALTRQLMEEEKMDKRIKRELPRLTQILVDKLSEWKEKHNEHFKYKSQSYLDIMDQQEEEWNTYKEEKHLRMQNKKHEEKSLGDSSRFAGKKIGRRPLGDAGNGPIRQRGKSRDPVKHTSRVLGEKSISTKF